MAVRDVSEAVEPVGDIKRPSFVLESSKRKYERQYANLYWLRLSQLRTRLIPLAKSKWSSLADGRRARHCPKLLDVEKGKLCFVVGTVYVDMPLKPNVLEDLSREHFVQAPAPRAKFCSPNDEVMLEDESGRVRLVGQQVVQAKVGQFVTGTIVTCLGIETETGDFEVLDLCFPGLPPPARVVEPRQGDTSSSSSSGGGKRDRWVAIVSGLEMGAEYEAADTKAMLFVDWILGELEASDQGDSEAIRVSRLIIAGNALGEPEELPAVTEETDATKKYGFDTTYSSNPAETLDKFLSELLPSIDIDLMPGETDPTGPTMPQQPLHHAMFPRSNASKGLVGRTNPCWLDIDGVSFFGTSGQTIDDIYKYLSDEDRLEMARKTLEWSHVAPTSPDTLWTYPYDEQDPFLLQKCPQVYFIGNQPEFQTKLVPNTNNDEEEKQEQSACRIVLVPEFCESGLVALVNLETLQVKTVQFQ